MATPIVLAVSAAGFLYIELANLVPGLHGRLGPAIGLRQFLVMLLGIATIMIAWASGLDRFPVAGIVSRFAPNMHKIRI